MTGKVAETEKGKVIEAEKGRQKNSLPCDGSLTNWPQWLQRGQAETRNSIQVSYLWGRRAHVLGPSSGAFPVTLTGSWIGSRATIPALTIWDASVAREDVTHSATMAVPTL